MASLVGILPELGPVELLLILAIVVVLFGATRLGDIGKSVGRGIREFRREMKDESEEATAGKDAVAKTEPAADTSKEKSSYTQH